MPFFPNGWQNTIGPNGYWPLGDGAPAEGTPQADPVDQTFLELLKLLLPYGVYSDVSEAEYLKDLSVHADALELCQDNSEALLNECFPDSTDQFLSSWERVYGLNQSDKPAFQRFQNLLAAVNARGGVSRAYIQGALRPFVGYDVEIEEYMVFRADDPRCLTDGDKYALDENYVFQFAVKIDNALITTIGYDSAAVQEAINRVKPAHTTGLLDTGSYGFFCDSVNSLTDLTLLAQ